MKAIKTRSLIIAVMALAIVATTVAYAALQTTLNISGSIAKKGGSWDIHFENVSNITNYFTSYFKSFLYLWIHY